MRHIRASLYQWQCKVDNEPKELTADGLRFISQYTKQSPDALRNHIVQVWKSAKKELWVYKCVQEFTFLLPKVSQHPHYQVVRACPGMNARHLHLDIGCCFGQDTRKLLLDGWSQDELIAADPYPDYWELGKDMFIDRDRLQVPFFTDSMTDAALDTAEVPTASLRLAQTLGSLVGAVTHIWAAAVLHVLSRDECELFLRNAFCLLCPGGSLYGWTLGAVEPKEMGYTPEGRQKRWAHSADSLSALFFEVGFCNVSVAITDHEMWGVEQLDKKQVALCFTAVV